MTDRSGRWGSKGLAKVFRPSCLMPAAAALLLAAAVWLLTRPEPAPRGTPSRWPLVTRLVALATMLPWIALALMIVDILPWSPGLAKALVLLALLGHAALAVLLGFHLSALAARAPDDTLARHAVNAGGATALACALLLVIQALELTTPIHLMFFTCSFPLIAGVLAIFLWASITVLRLGLVMRESARAGDEIKARRLQRMAAQKR
jgi:hypothetical protein